MQRLQRLHYRIIISRIGCPRPWIQTNGNTFQLESIEAFLGCELLFCLRQPCCSKGSDCRGWHGARDVLTNSSHQN